MTSAFAGVEAVLDRDRRGGLLAEIGAGHGYRRRVLPVKRINLDTAVVAHDLPLQGQITAIDYLKLGGRRFGWSTSAGACSPPIQPASGVCRTRTSTVSTSVGSSVLVMVSVASASSVKSVAATVTAAAPVPDAGANKITSESIDIVQLYGAPPRLRTLNDADGDASVRQDQVGADFKVPLRRGRLELYQHYFKIRRVHRVAIVMATVSASVIA